MITELSQDWEDETLGGHGQNFVRTRSQERGEVIPKEPELDLPMCAWESPVEVEVNGGLHTVRGTDYDSPGRPGMLA